ncbi:unnamed protein product [Cuscuta campestris]|uniref:Uncharacterized protein n=1 Tax=Cuscuta campestris TaxID=132261 RepID=A0A484MCN7_9ASTE|nr:unnamed protein product [Cuscuta campestris]
MELEKNLEPQPHQTKMETEKNLEAHQTQLESEKNLEANEVPLQLQQGAGFAYLRPFVQVPLYVLQSLPPPVFGYFPFYFLQAPQPFSPYYVTDWGNTCSKLACGPSPCRACSPRPC